ncbi:polyphenol oxidase family protein [Ottowia pentelensis]|uniref:polyphenol oxidase family protein n=1 Tax=Ottowia pentelensis TaxID=511108 RepID=UPI00362BD0C7
MRGAEGLVPDWPAPPSVRAVFSTRGRGAHDGASAAPFDFFNLGDHVGDDPAAVAANRERLRRALGVRPIYLNQVHGSEVLALHPDLPDGARADAALTDRPGLACTVMVADCLPVLFTDLRGRAVAAAHAGWRGLAGGVLEATLKQFRALAGMQQAPAAIDNEVNEIIAWLGPCIGPRAFEVGPEVRAAFVGGDAGAAACFIAQADGKWPTCPRWRGAGWPRRAWRARTATMAAPTGAPWATRRAFSYRRDQRRLGGSGRMAACIWRV